MSAIILDKSVDGVFRDMLRRVFGRGAAKKASPWADVSHYAIEQWLQCRREPGMWSLFKLARHPQFRAELRNYLDHIEQQEAVLEAKMERIRAERLRSVARVDGPSGKPARTASLRATVAEHGVCCGGVGK